LSAGTTFDNSTFLYAVLFIPTAKRSFKNQIKPTKTCFIWVYLVLEDLIINQIVFFLKDSKRNLWGAFRSGGARQTGSGSHRRGKKCVLFRLAAGGDMIGSGRCQ
jgi:hypothetical protein